VGWRNLLFLVRRNLKRMKLRVAMTAMGVLIGTAAIVLLVSLGAGLQRLLQDQMGSVNELTEIQVSSPRGDFFFGTGSAEQESGKLDERTLDDFRELPGVVAVSPVAYIRAMSSVRLNRLETYGSLAGIDPRELNHMGWELESGIARLGKWQCLVGPRVAQGFRDPQTGARAAETPELQGQILELVVTRIGQDGEPVERIVRLRVAGVLAETGGQNDYTLFLALNEALDLNAWATGERPNPRSEGYEQAFIKVASTRQVLAVEQEIARRGFPTYSAQSAVRSMNLFFLAFQIVLGGIGAVALLVAGFGIANAMIMAIYERTREIGLMKAVGARNRDVMFVFLAEAGTIGLIGGLGGVGLGWIAGLVASLFAGAYLESLAAQSGAAGTEIPALVYTPWWLMAGAVLFAGLVGILSGVYPALRATNLDPIAALRYE
jgi:putative ABC transport system permease protein